MGLRQGNVGRLGRQLEPTASVVTIPPSVGGVNAYDPLMAMPPQDCIYTYNLMPSEFGLRLRKGYREWATNVGTSHTEVRSIIPYEGHDPSKDKLFAVTADGIYNVTLYNTDLPAQVVAFSNTGNDAGYAVWTEMTLDNGNQVLFLADPENGLQQYSEATEAWSVPLFTGPTVANIAHVNLFKQRLWVVEKNTAHAYYSAVDSIAGTMTKFTFGSKFRYGGELVGTWSWTFDGGAGVNDFLVAISRGGDLLVYQGSDPALADFETVGAWFIGEIPAGRKIVVQHGGEFYILSTFGLLSLRDLLQGVGASEADTTAKKINRPLRQAIQDKKDTYGWALQANPPDGFLQILAPFTGDSNALQYAQNLQTKAWGFWRNVPILSADTWNGEYFMGGEDGQVYQYYGDVDNAKLDGTAGVAIAFSTLTSFQPYGNHGTNKQAGMFRVIAVTAGDTTYNLKAVYDYNIYGEAGAPVSPETRGAYFFDTALWDEALWDGLLNGDSQIQGGESIGRVVAVAMRGESTSRVTIVGWDATISEGGFL